MAKKYDKNVFDSFLAGVLSVFGVGKSADKTPMPTNSQLKQRGIISPLADNQNQTPAPKPQVKQTTPQTSGIGIFANQKKDATSKGEKYSKDSVNALIDKYFPDDTKTARAIAMQESSLNPEVVNPDNPGAIGLMQINLPAHLKDVPGDTYAQKAENLKNPEINLHVAKIIQDKQGWKPWEAYTSGAYKKYLDQ